MADLRRDFDLPEEDVQFLNSLNLTWEAIKEGNARAVILCGFPMSQLFQPTEVNLKIKIPNDYTSGAALDMFFTDVPVTRADGAAIKALTESAVFNAKKWWQWSRHYPKDTKWRPGTDNLGTHICFVQHVLDEEGRGKSWA